MRRRRRAQIESATSGGAWCLLAALACGVHWLVHPAGAVLYDLPKPDWPDLCAERWQSTLWGGHNPMIDDSQNMRLRVGCEFDYQSEAPVPMLMLVRAQPDGEHRILYESRWTDPEVPIREYVDSFNNYCWRFMAPPGRFRIRYDALVAIAGEPDLVVPDAPLTRVEDLPDATLVFTLPSRYIQSDLLIQTAWDLFGTTPETWARVQAVCDWVHTNIGYETGSSDPTVTALDVYERRVGVCRDFALLATGLCRALNIPARYTFGYFPDIAVEPPDVPMDFHAWFEAYLGGRWYSFDARHNVPRIGRVVIGHGRDAVDVAMVTQYGNSRLTTMTVWSDEVTADPAHDHDADELEAAESPWPSTAL